MSQRCSLVGIVTFLLVSVSLLIADEPPPVFAKKTLEDSLKDTVGTEKILVVKATAAWCAPCKQMDRTTWRDKKVVQWFADNGLAIQIDVDERREEAKTLDIDAMPTMVAFKNGKDFDRIVGYQDADQLLAWLADVKAGKRRIDKVRTKLQAREAGKADMSVRERHESAQELVQAREYDKATDEYVWLWNNILTKEPAYVGVRGSFMAGDMERLAARHRPAMDRFRQMRDKVERALNEGRPNPQLRDDWVVLNQVVGEDARTLEWFDRIKDELSAADEIKRVSFRLEQLLEAEERWADFGILVKDPVEAVRRDYGFLQEKLRRGTPADLRNIEKEMRELDHRFFREDAGKLYGSLLASKRDKEAAKLAAEAMKLDDTGEMRATLVEWALRMKQPRDVQLDWLKQAEEKGADVKRVRRLLENALDK